VDHSTQRQAIITQIKAAFANVRLEDGVGLRQAQGIDDYQSDETCRALRQRDEKEDWQKIPVKELEDCYSSLSFFDAKGMRFHLPAFMIADLEGSYGPGARFILTHLNDYTREQFSLLSSEQRAAVAAYLTWLL